MLLSILAQSHPSTPRSLPVQCQRLDALHTQLEASRAIVDVLSSRLVAPSSAKQLGGVGRGAEPHWTSILVCGGVRRRIGVPKSGEATKPSGESGVQ